MLTYILSIICAFAFLVFDQISKAYISANLTLNQQPIEFIKGIIDITYIYNTGGAWGVLSGKTWILLVATLIIMAFCVVLLIKNYKKNPLLFWSLSLIISGGMGNIIDRVFRDGKVVDFLQFHFWQDFPVFNIADCAIVVGAGLLILYTVLGDKTEKGNKNGDN